jgi:hypothetical protein
MAASAGTTYRGLLTGPPAKPQVRTQTVPDKKRAPPAGFEPALPASEAEAKEILDLH